MRISALNVFPIKSCRGISAESAVLTDSGLRWDREWMVVKKDTGKFVTARQEAKLLLITPSIPSEAITSADWQARAGDVMEVQAEGMPALRVPLSWPKTVQPVTANVWEWTGTVHDEGDEAAAWFSKYLGQEVRLVRYLGQRGARAAPPPEGAEPISRHVDYDYAPGWTTSFTDGFPCLLANESSLADLGAKIGTALPMARFRPNIVVAGAEPWAEDSWSQVKVTGSGKAALDFMAVKPCTRCKVTTLDPETAEGGDEPLDTMGTFRTGEQLGLSGIERGFKTSVMFGVNVVSLAGGNKLLSVGDAVAAQAEGSGMVANQVARRLAATVSAQAKAAVRGGAGSSPFAGMPRWQVASMGVSAGALVLAVLAKVLRR